MAVYGVLTFLFSPFSSGRADWTWISTTGQVTTYINQRGDGPGMVPHWREAGVTHGGMGENTGETRENIQFARIFGSGRSDVRTLTTLLPPFIIHDRPPCAD